MAHRSQASRHVREATEAARLKNLTPEQRAAELEAKLERQQRAANRQAAAGGDTQAAVSEADIPTVTDQPGSEQEQPDPAAPAEVDDSNIDPRANDAGPRLGRRRNRRR